jgi:hypothetical protein
MKASFLVRPYLPQDRAAVRRICAETGYLGTPIDPVFEDRELFADFLTGYYLDWEPDSTFVCVMEGEVKGYVMGCRREALKTVYDALHAPVWVARGLFRWFTRPYGERTRQYIRWLATKGRKETPPVPPGAAHFHFNVLSEARSLPGTLALVNALLAHMGRCGEKAIYAQMVAVGGARTERMYNRFGFATVNRREVTKYRDVSSEPVFLVTILKDLTVSDQLSGSRLKES